MGSLEDERRLSPEQLRWTCDPADYPFESTEVLRPVEGTVGQARAIEALMLGLELYSPGYNVFVSGLTGTGRTTTIKQILETIQPKCALPSDRCYVHNFRNPDRPRLLTLPRGMGVRFREDMERVVEFLRKNLPAICEDESFRKRRETIVNRVTQQEREMFTRFEKKLKERGFTLGQVQIGPFTRPDVVPIVEGKPIPFDNLGRLVEEGDLDAKEFEEIRARYEEYKAELDQLVRRGRKLAEELEREVDNLQKSVCTPVLRDLLGEIKEKYENENVDAYLEEVEEDVLGNLKAFLQEGEKGEEGPVSLARRKRRDLPFENYEVNVILDNSNREGCPVVIENNPTFTNLFGTIEKEVSASGVWRTDYRKIKGGALLQADGGYLVVNALDVLLEPGVWPHLKRALKTRTLEIQGVDAVFQISPIAMKPQPIDLNVKVVMIGDAELYTLLHGADDDFAKIFKVRADFDSEMDLTRENVRHFAAVVCKVCHEENLKHIEREGLAALVEYGVRRAGRRGKITTRFSPIADVAREAHFWATKEDSRYVQREHIERAIEAAKRRNNLVEEKIEEMIRESALVIETDGKRVGQVNGLAVYEVGNYMFGKPSRITVSVAMGRAGIINIEREAKLSGRTHDKGILILAGFLRSRFARSKPLSLSASICFEQSYAGVDGDSASSTEVYGLLSALAEVPIRQGVAVTGSVDQRGNVQAIGGVNEKIEGFFKVCRSRGLTGDQGVMIPASNVGDLMLDPEVVQAVAEGKFRIWAVRDVDEGIEILTGMPAGRPEAEGRFPEGTINSRVDRALRDLAEGMVRFAKGAAGDARGSEDAEPDLRPGGES